VILPSSSVQSAFITGKLLNLTASFAGLNLRSSVNQRSSAVSFLTLTARNSIVELQITIHKSKITNQIHSEYRAEFCWS
jgi:hypothetical protein